MIKEDGTFYMSPSRPHPSVSIHSALLKEHRRRAGFTQAAFAAACGSVSLATVRRAEQGHRVIKSAMHTMAKTLGQPVDYYISNTTEDTSSGLDINLSGDWRGYYVERDRGSLPYIVSDDLCIRQKGSMLEGDFHSNNPHKPPKESLNNCRIVGNVLTGSCAIEGWRLPSGLSTFTLMVTRNHDWMDGYVSWYDPGNHQIETSRLIYVRKSAPCYSHYNTEAKGVMAQEQYLYRLRNLIESGYSVDETITMLRAVGNGAGPPPRKVPPPAQI